MKQKWLMHTQLDYSDQPISRAVRVKQIKSVVRKGSDIHFYNKKEKTICTFNYTSKEDVEKGYSDIMAILNPFIV